MKVWTALAATLIAAPSAFALIDAKSPPLDKDRFLQILTQHPEVTKLEQVPAILPEEFLMNFVLKHGVKRTGERGHLIEAKVSQSADPLLPRAILWDERSGFSLSYNGGGHGQTAGQRVDLLHFDPKSKTFSAEQIDFPIEGGRPKTTMSDCNTCHGPNFRPIFAMYPDWPSFYGSDNDELTGKTPTQEKEFSDYRKFLKEVATKNPRYSPLYSDARVRKYLGRPLYSAFPYRPDTSTTPRNTSRAFAFRPELRLGFLYNRMTAQMATQKITNHTNYKTLGTYFLFNLLECSWPKGHESAQARWLEKVESALGEKAKTVQGGLDYRQMWKLFGLTINDIDIRYSYNHEGYKNIDATKKVMEVGYIGRYFNSYFDGSATIDELVASAIYEDLSRATPALKGISKPWGLVAKYKHFEDRYKLDEAFFKQMDSMGGWIHIPFPKALAAVHHREVFTSEFAQTHLKLCTALKGQL